jgi:glucokinase
MAPENPQLLTIGVDLGGTNLRIAAYSPDSGVLHSIALPTRLEAGPLAVVDDMCDAILELLSQYSKTHNLAGIGVGSNCPPDASIIRPIFPGGTGFTCSAKWKSACACRLRWRATPT